MSAAQNTADAGRAEFRIHELTPAVSRMKNGETRMVVGTISGAGKDYRFSAAKTHWYDDQPETDVAVCFRQMLNGRPVNAPGALSSQRAAVLAHPEVIAALAAAKTGGAR